MARKRDLKFFECLDCESVTLLGSITSESTCPGCGSANRRVISSSELERRIEGGAVYSIDLSPDGYDEPSQHPRTCFPAQQ
jgi:hypothetical protein